MLSRVMRSILGLVLRVVLLLAGLVFLVSLLAAALLVLVVWLLRALWARLTGKPVQPWTFQINRQAMWNRFHQAQGGGQAAAGDQSDVIDVEAKPVKAAGDPTQLPFR